MDLRKKKSPAVFARPGRKDFAADKPISWREFLQKVAMSQQESYLGLLEPNYSHCDPCYVKYDAVIKMENFDADSQKILSIAGIQWLKSSHENSHGDHSLN